MSDIYRCPGCGADVESIGYFHTTYACGSEQIYKYSVSESFNCSDKCLQNQVEAAKHIKDDESQQPLPKGRGFLGANQ